MFVYISCRNTISHEPTENVNLSLPLDYFRAIIYLENQYHPSSSRRHSNFSTTLDIDDINNCPTWQLIIRNFNLILEVLAK